MGAEVVQTKPVMAGDLTPLVMLERAVSQGANIETLERLMGLSERWHDNQAKRVFSEALANARGDLPLIVKNRKVDFSTQKGRTHYQYEDLSEMIEQLAPVLTKHGLSFRWRTDSETPGYVKVTCILSHRDGYSEETALSGPYDTSGNKNAIQAIGSVVTYLQRYTLKASLGIAAGADDDGRQGAPTEAPPQSTVTTGQVMLANDLLRSSAFTFEERRAAETFINARPSKDHMERFLDRLKAKIAAHDKAPSVPQDAPDEELAHSVGPDPEEMPAAQDDAEPPGADAFPATIGPQKAGALKRFAAQFGVPEVDVLRQAGVERMEDIPEALYKDLRAWIQAHKP